MTFRKGDNWGHLHTLRTSEKEQQERRSRQTGRRRRPSGAGSPGDYHLVNSIALVTFFVTNKWITLTAFIDGALYKTRLHTANAAAGFSVGWLPANVAKYYLIYSSLNLYVQRVQISNHFNKNANTIALLTYHQSTTNYFFDTIWG